MTNPASAFQPAIDALEKDLAELERQANGLLQSINLLREKAGLPPRPGGWSLSGDQPGEVTSGAALKLHSDAFLGKKLGSAVREYLEMRKRSGVDAPATSREIFDALKEGGFSSGAKDDATALVVLRTMLRKNTAMFFKLPNGKFGLRSWYPDLKAPKAGAEEEEEDNEATAGAEAEKKEPYTPSWKRGKAEAKEPEKSEAAATKKAATAS